MVITRIYGGLGNQMFQYAIGRSISLQKKTMLKMDISSFSSYKLRNYKLSVFNIEEKFAKQSELPLLITEKNYFKKSCLQLVNKLIPTSKRLVIYEQDSITNADCLAQNVYLIGYWQSEKYFKKDANQIRQDFAITKKLTPSAKNWLKQIKSTLSVSLHVRRGDYVSDFKTSQRYNIDLTRYYRKSMAILKQKVNKPVFFVFSDDYKWVQGAFSGKQNIRIVSDNKLQDYEELYLISKCQHNITANSTFSWWGAWLNNSPDKIVLTPRHWYKDQPTSPELIPNKWIKI